MVSLLEIFLSAILGDLASRSVDFFVSRRAKPPAPQDVEDRLRRVLLRVQVIIDEAMGRRQPVTNQAMLWQLDALTDAVHRGYYALYTFRSQTSHLHHEEAASSSNGQIIVSLTRQPVASDFSKVAGSVKHLCSPSATNGREISEEMQEVLDRLSTMIIDAHELVLFLANDNSRRRIDRQPYSMYLLLGHCMFGRQREAQLVIDFLLQAQHPGVEEPEVLPIIGPFRVGKSTLVAHVSRSDKIAKLGTSRTLTLKPLSHEAYWYFFRTLAFGSADPMSHPRQLTNLAMDIASTLNGSMIIANIAARMLRDSFSVHFWGKFATFMRSQFQRHVSNFGEHPYDLLNQNKPVYFGRIHRRSEQVIAYHQYHRHSSQQDHHQVPKITLHDVTYGDAKLPGRFEAMAWRSAIPPYYSYIYACEIQELKSFTGNKRKRSTKNSGALP